LRSAEALQIPTELVRTWRPRRRFTRFTPPTFRVIGKGDKERVVLFSAEAVRAARDLLPFAHLSVSTTRLIPWSDRGMRFVIAEIGARAGVHAHPHRFRHTAITEWVESGTPIDVVADMAGHSSIDVTRLYYQASITARVRAERRRRRWRKLRLPA
jgi:integrase